MKNLSSLHHHHHHHQSVKSLSKKNTMDNVTLRDEEVRQRIRLAEEFLDPSDQAARSYRADIILMLNQKRRRLQVSLDEIREHNRELADGLLSQPFDISLAFNEALKNVVKALPNRPRAESGEDVVCTGLWETNRRTRREGERLTWGLRSTTAPSSAALASMRATRAP